MIWFIGTLILAALSWRAFADRRSSRFGLFLAEATLWAVLVMSAPGWFRDPLSIAQIVSWILLAGALVLAVSAFVVLSGGRRSPRRSPGTTRPSQVSPLVTNGPYRYVRHPLYAALMLLAWGAAFKAPSFFSIVLALITTGLLYYTSYQEELENLERFGQEYDLYMGTTTMFIPGVF
jgi:protein-S-isoprenylcysteine O-methyltransferase Ste14